MTSSNDTSSSGPPNVVFIVGDNVGWGDIGCYGGTAPTPRIDACRPRHTSPEPSSSES